MANGIPTRLVVIGNSGSGKSTFAKRVSATLGIRTHDLDILCRHVDGRKRGEDDARALVAEVAAGAGWVIEGVFPSLVEVAFRRATALVWLDLSWDDCQAGLLQRGPHYAMDPSNHNDLLAWEAAHWGRRSTPAQLFDAFGGSKVRLRTRGELEDFSLESLSGGSR